MSETIRFRLNGRPVALDVDGGRPLLWVLRTDLGLTGTKYGCGEGICGACTVLVDGEAVRSCRVAVRDVAGQDVVTIEGLARGEALHPLQEAFMVHDALQCGYCTPGMILTAYAFLKKSPAHRRCHRGRPRGQPVPLRRSHPDHRGRPGGRRQDGRRELTWANPEIFRTTRSCTGATTRTPLPSRRSTGAFPEGGGGI